MLFHGDTEIGEFEWVGRRDAQAYCRIANDSWTCRIDSRWPVQISIIGNGASPRLMYAGSFGEGRAELSDGSGYLQRYTDEVPIRSFIDTGGVEVMQLRGPYSAEDPPELFVHIPEGVISLDQGLTLSCLAWSLCAMWGKKPWLHVLAFLSGL